MSPGRFGPPGMNRPEAFDDMFAAAVRAIDAGDITALQRLLAAHPRLVHDRLDDPGAWLRDKVGDALNGFFARPYLLWFVAEDPVRTGRLPANIADVAGTIISAARREGATSLQDQLDYTLRLVSWSGVASDCQVQLGLLDVLIDAGASPDGRPDDALVNGHIVAAAHLVDRGARLSLATALCLARWDDAQRLGVMASAQERQFAFILLALRGNVEGLARVISLGVDLSTPCDDLYSHATALHHAVYSGSLDAVTLLVEAGAALDAKDSIYDGTPLDWAEHGEHAQIADYLRGLRR